MPESSPDPSDNGRPAPSPSVGYVLRGTAGRYRLLRTITADRLGTVFLAEVDDDAASRAVVTLLPSRLGCDSTTLHEVRRHIRRVAGLAQQCHALAAVSEWEPAGDGGLAIVTEPMQGQLLSELVAERGALSLDRALRLAIRIGEGLEAAHNAGLVHGCLTLSSVMVLASDDAIKLLGFEHAGLLDIISPDAGVSAAADQPAEPLPTGPASERADIAAFGCVLGSMLVGSARAGPGSPLSSLPLLSRIRYRIPARVKRVIREATRARRDRGPDEIGRFINELCVERTQRERSQGRNRPDLRRYALAAIIPLLFTAGGIAAWVQLSTRTRAVRPLAGPGEAPSREFAVGEAAITVPEGAPAQESSPDALRSLPPGPAQVRPPNREGLNEATSRGRATRAPDIDAPRTSGALKAPGGGLVRTSKPNAARGGSASLAPAPFREAPIRDGDMRAPPANVEDDAVNTVDPAAVIDWLLKEAATRPQRP